MLVVAVRSGADPQDGRIAAATPYAGAPGAAIRLRVTARGAEYDFSYALPGEDWRVLLAHADGTVLASERTNLFTGTLIGVYAARDADPQ